jgi:hypothetical chaperone protein
VSFSKEKLIYAIDFGTSNSLLTAADASGAVHADVPLDPHASDPRILRSLLYFPSGNQVFYGEQAISKFQENQSQGRLIRSIKKQLPSKSFVGTWIDDRPVNLEDLIGYFLAEVRKRANTHFGQEIDTVVLGRPARFSVDDADDKFAEWRLTESAKRAGFKHIELFPEPLAAAYEFRMGLTSPKTVFVADFGGGTSDFTVMKMSQKPFHPSDVLSIGGVPLAGDALDGSVMRHHLSRDFGGEVEYTVPFSSNRIRMPGHLMEKLCSPADISFLMQRDIGDFLEKVKKWTKKPQDIVSLDRLFCLLRDQLGFYVFEEIDGAKRRLSDAEVTEISLPYPGIDLEREITRPRFEEAAASPIRSILETLDRTLADAGVKPADIDLVCSTGGTAKVPVLHRELVKRFGAEKIQRHKHFHSVVEGLARRALDLRS